MYCCTAVFLFIHMKQDFSAEQDKRYLLSLFKEIVTASMISPLNVCDCSSVSKGKHFRIEVHCFSGLHITVITLSGPTPHILGLLIISCPCHSSHPLNMSKYILHEAKLCAVCIACCSVYKKRMYNQVQIEWKWGRTRGWGRRAT